MHYGNNLLGYRVRHGLVFRDPTRGQRYLLAHSNELFLDIKHLFSESIRTLSKLRRTKSLSYLELLFVVSEVRH